MQAAKESLEALEKRFKAAGGLSKEERNALLLEQTRNDKVKQECAHAIRSFVEIGMPLFITRAKAIEADNQLRLEKQIAQYRSVEGRHLSDDEYFPKYVKAHIDRGALILDSKYRHAGSVNKYVLETLGVGDTV